MGDQEGEQRRFFLVDNAFSLVETEESEEIQSSEGKEKKRKNKEGKKGNPNFAVVAAYRKQLRQFEDGLLDRKPDWNKLTPDQQRLYWAIINNEKEKTAELQLTGEMLDFFRQNYVFDLREPVELGIHHGCESGVRLMDRSVLVKKGMRGRHENKSLIFVERSCPSCGHVVFRTEDFWVGNERLIQREE